MPKKNQVPVNTVDGVVEVDPENVVMGENGFELKTCGHVNKQHYNVKGRLEDLPCDLLAGHAGDHHAAYQRNVPNHIYNNKGGVEKAQWDQVEAEAFWGNDAGTPAGDIKEKEAKQFTSFQRDLVQEILRKNPDLSADEAYKQAKESPVWLAGNV
jgi:hypothetical protein